MAEEFALHETLEHRPNLKFEQTASWHTKQHVCRRSCGCREKNWGLNSVLDADTTAGGIELFAESEEGRLYWLQWTKEAQIIGYMVIVHGATVQHAVAANNEWTFRVLSPERNGVSATADFANEHGLSRDLRRLNGVEDAHRVRVGFD